MNTTIQIRTLPKITIERMSMIIASPLDSASARLTWSNAMYLVGSGLTVITALFVLYETRAVALGKRVKLYLASEIAVAISALLSLAGSFGAIHYGNLVSHLKDLDLEAYKTVADRQIAKAQNDAGLANQGAAQANLENTQLRIQLAQHETSEKKAEAVLTVQNQKLTQFTEGIAQQQQGMAQQMQTTPTLGDAQIDAIAAALKPFSGQAISVHTMMDLRSQRLAAQFQQAFMKAGIKIEGSSTDFGPNYVGVMVMVKNPSPNPHPPVADALLHAIHLVGISPHPTANPSIQKEDEVWLCIGPE